MLHIINHVSTLNDSNTLNTNISISDLFGEVPGMHPGEYGGPPANTEPRPEGKINYGSYYPGA